MKTLKLIWKLIKYRPWVYFLSAGLWAIVEVIPLLPVIIVREILDSLTVNTSLDSRFWWMVGLMAGVYLVRIIFTYAATASWVFYGFFAEGLLRQNLLKAILKRPGSKSLSITPSEALNRFRDDVGAINDILGWPMDVFGKFLGAIVAVAILLSVNAKMTLMVIFPLFVVLSLVQQVRKKVHKYRQESRRATSRVIGAMGEMFSSVQAIQVAGAEEHVIKHFNNLNQNRHKAMIKDTLFIKLVEAILNNIVHIGTGFILLMSAQSMRIGDLSVGDFALFISYWFTVADFTENFGGMLSSFHQARVSFDRLIELQEGNKDEDLVQHQPLYLRKDPVKDINTQMFDEKDALQILEVKGLNYSFPDSDAGIKNINLTVKGGSFTVITGRIGSGKSTLLRVLLGLLPADEGSIVWNGKEVEDASKFFVPPISAYTGQVPHLFSDTLRNNILLAQLGEDDEMLQRAIYSAVLEKDLDSFENGLETMIGPRGVKLSGGQIQRVAAARMLASKAQLYVFDDISSALDVETESILWNRMINRKDVTCIAVSNRPIALEKADQIIVMKDGAIEAMGSLDELIENCQEFSFIYNQRVQTA